MFFSWRKRAETELDREIAHHLHHLSEEYIRQGASREEALRLAKREFGGVDQVRENCRDERRWAWTTGLAQDVAFGLRMMRKTPVVTAAAVISLALGIGANAAIVSLMDIVLWRELPVPDAQRISLVHWQGEGFPRELADGASGSMFRDNGASVADFFSWRAFQALSTNLPDRATVAAFNYPDAVSTSYAGRPSVAQERPVSGNFFQTIGINARLGRVLTGADDSYGAVPAVVVSHRFWVRALGSDESAVGKTMIVDDKPHFIAGILPKEFYGLMPGDPTDVYVPVHSAASVSRRKLEKDPLQDDRYWGYSMLLRRKPGVAPDQLRSTMDAVFRSTWTRAPKNTATAPRIRLDDGSGGLDRLRRDFRNPLLVLACLVGLLLAIACINIANLLLARANARQREVSTRVALGCGQARLIRQFLTESALLAVLGGMASVAVAWLTANVLGQFVGTHGSVPLVVELDWRILATIGASTGLTLLLFGLFPAWRASRLAAPTSLRQERSGMGHESRKTARAGRVLVLAQMGMSVVLVLAAVLFTRNLLAIESVDPGFDRRNLILFGIRPGTSGYEKTRLEQFYFNLEQQLASVRGVSAVGLASMRPMNIGGWWEGVRLPGQSEIINASLNGVTAGYLPLFNGRLLAGRQFTPSDIATGADVAIVSEDLADKLGGQSVVGRHLEFADGPPNATKPRFEIVGIAPAFAATSMKERPFAVWRPFVKDAPEATVVLRTAGPPQVVATAVRQAMSGLDRNLPLIDFMTMEQQISKGLQRERMFATLCSGFGLLALLLSVVGLYGVISYNTSRRRGEIGIRLALGAEPKDVLVMVMREGMSLAILGIAAAAPIVWFGARYLDKELFQMKPLDPASIAVTLGVLLLAALTAALIPAFRASILDPAQTLRHD